ncbi:MAG: glycosyltransferase family 4 protein [Nostoc sp. C3-bin3]|nr:glycosyltransferase family 4 protein [Nostoc sp. C3-bin3]
MAEKKLKALLIIESCNPDWAAVHSVGYGFYSGIKNFVDVTLVTHERNKEALQKAFPDENNIIYITDSSLTKRYLKIIDRVTKFGELTIWPLYNALVYPAYEEFNQTVFSLFGDAVLNGEFDIVHAITPVIPRYPVKIVDACQKTPFFIGPLNGGLPFPPGFQEISRKEFSFFNFLRTVGRLTIPGYRKTYKKADKILSGSLYTLNWIKEYFSIEDEHIDLMHENGIVPSFLKSSLDISEPKNLDKQYLELLFVGRLVPYKGADMLVEAINNLQTSIKERVRLTIVGDGIEREVLEQKILAYNLQEKISITGWIPKQETLKYYSSADVFCFPSIREFGGAVVLEAMANGLPCIVIDYGGIGEYVTEETGFKIPPTSKEYVVEQLKQHIECLVSDEKLRQQMSEQAVQRAKEYTWENKASQIVTLYKNALGIKEGILDEVRNS